LPKVQQETTKSKRVTDVLSRIGPIGFKEGDGLKVCLYGQSGSGKTTFWATWPKPILAIIVSGGSNPGELRSIDTPDYRKTIQSVTLREPGELSQLTDFLSGDSKFKTVVLDHASGLQDMTLREILGIEKLPEQKSWGMASREQYGQCALKMKEMLRTFLDLDSNVIVVAQERDFNSDTDSDILMPSVAAALSPSVVGWLNPACDYIVNTFKRERRVETSETVGGKTIKRMKKIDGEVDYCLRVGPDPVYTTKFRMPKGSTLPYVITDPTYDKMLKLIRGN
jgi:hypothetical protein